MQTPQRKAWESNPAPPCCEVTTPSTNPPCQPAEVHAWINRTLRNLNLQAFFIYRSFVRLSHFFHLSFWVSSPWQYALKSTWMKWSLSPRFWTRLISRLLRPPVSLPELWHRDFNQGGADQAAVMDKLFLCVSIVQLFHQERETKCSLHVLFAVGQ